MKENSFEIGRFWREEIGSLWEEVGRLQFEFLLDRGLEPHHRLLDIGCGCLRAGVHLIGYLESGHYYGIDRDEMFLAVGRHYELEQAELGDKAPRLHCCEDFDCSVFETDFDFIIAQSLFTHLPWNSILRCLANVREVLKEDGEFYATFFEDFNGAHKTIPIRHEPGGVVSYPDRDPYHYEFSVFEDLAERCGLTVEFLGTWDHPRAQRIMVFRKSEDLGSVAEIDDVDVAPLDVGRL